VIYLQIHLHATILINGRGLSLVCIMWIEYLDKRATTIISTSNVLFIRSDRDSSSIRKLCNL